MEMCYDGALIMPSNYAVMDADEMTYVEGGGFGKHWWNKSSVVAAAIDILTYTIPAIAALNSYCKVGRLASLGRVYIRNNINIALRRAKIQLASAVLSGIVNSILTVAGTSIGGLIVWGINRIDGDGNNNYVFA